MQENQKSIWKPLFVVERKQLYDFCTQIMSLHTVSVTTVSISDLHIDSANFFLLVQNLLNSSSFMIKRMDYLKNRNLLTGLHWIVLKYRSQTKKTFF